MSFGIAHPLSVQQRVHHLNKNENLEAVLFRIQKGCIIQFKLGTSLFGQKVKLLTNYPRDPDKGFNRSEYQELAWKSQSLNKGDDASLYCELMPQLAGTYHYFFFPSESAVTEPSGSGCILVEPTLTYGPENEVLPLDCILCETYLAKCLGPFPMWEKRLLTAKETGYNMVHITPVQELGASLSSYSLRNQLKLNPMFSTNEKAYTMDDLAALVAKMRKEWQILAITDVVLNHTANESEWLLTHPEATYNLINSPHLRPAYLLDRALWYFSIEISEGKWMQSGIPTVVCEEKHLDSIRSALYGFFLCKLKIYEMFMVDVETLVEEFRSRLPDARPNAALDSKELVIIQNVMYQRLASNVDMNIAFQIYGDCCQRNKSFCETDACCVAFRGKLNELNRDMKSRIENHLNAAVENVIRGIRYERVDKGGPKLGTVSKKYPLVPQYFLNYGPDTDLNSDETLLYSDNACYIMAHNGWVMGDNPLKNFADSDSDVYLRRELIAWGDSVKLRYGECPEDSPYLWEHMTRYVQETAKTFYGLRLDNCHSTPINAAEYLIDQARKVRPDLYVIAELFTSSEAIDNIFVNRLGITSLVREAMSAPNAHEQGRLVYRYGGLPVGAFVFPMIRPLAVGIAHAIFMDITHDNPTPIQTRSVYDLFPTAAIVTMACCATGSTRGYDELVPHHIHVVDETRHYMSWGDSTLEGNIDMESGIIAGKKALNELHIELGMGGYTQVFVDQKDSDTIAITRHCPATHQSVILVARTSFTKPNNPLETGFVPNVKIPGIIDGIIFEGKLEPISPDLPYVRHSRLINGLRGYKLILNEHLLLFESKMVDIFNQEENELELSFCDFPRGSVIAFRVSLNNEARQAILNIRTSVTQFGFRMRTYSGQMIQRNNQDFESIISRLSLADINRVLFRCDAEERDDGNGFGAYDIPKYGPLTYCGLQGLMSELMSIHLQNDLGHPLCENLRQGDWLANYVADRLVAYPSTNDLGCWFKNVLKNLRFVPRYLVPCYFDTIITGAYTSVLTALWRKMPDFIAEGSNFVKSLALASVILAGVVKTSPLPSLSPALSDPPPLTDGSGDVQYPQCITLSAGLPHFCAGYMRNWGRDTFISLRGLLLITERNQEARYLILAYGECLRHGLIPNLLDRGVNARFNCRDAVWWWLQSVQDYTTMVPKGHTILKDPVSRLFPTDDSPPREPGFCDQPLCDVIQEALQKHFVGLKFRERNAGSKIDDRMTDNGFNNEIGVNEETGFVFGGNSDNCGTWMDKMGSSDSAGNKGIPATPRDGSAVELVGLSYSALVWLDKQYNDGNYPYSFVEKSISGEDADVTEKVVVSFKEWAERIRNNFETCFWVSGEIQPTDSKYINKREMYKDSYGSTYGWTDFQLRPNFCVAMVVAPDLFTPERAWKALKTAETHLLSVLGMKTLDPSDWAYNGNYNNDDSSNNKNTAKGFNYHQGPEWLWPIGYFLRAKLIFSQRLKDEEVFQLTVASTKQVLSRHFYDLQNSKWKGLPELTNQNGAECRDGCPIQAWSHATILEVLYDLDNSFGSS